MDTVELQILGLGGPVCSVVAERTWTVRQLKTRIYELSNMLVDDQGLFWGSSELQNGAVLAEALPREDRLDLALLRRETAVPEMLKDPRKLRDASRAVILACLAHRGLLLVYVDPEFANDMEVVLTAVDQDPFALQHATENMRNNSDVVKAAVRKNGCCLQHASAAMRMDIDIVLEAVKTNAVAIVHADRGLQNHQRWREVVLAAVRNNGEILQDLPAFWKQDRETVLTVAQHWPYAMRYAAAELRKDQEVSDILRNIHQMSP